MASVRKCKNDPKSFCYTSVELSPKASRRPTSDFYKKGYRAYIHAEVGDQYKLWPPHTVCKTRLENMRWWSSGTWKSFRYLKIVEVRHTFDLAWSREPIWQMLLLFSQCYGTEPKETLIYRLFQLVKWLLYQILKHS